MKELKFKDCAHSSWETSGAFPELYKIDWESNEEKFKTPCMHHLRVYQGGRINLRTSGIRAPHLRIALFKEYGIDLRTLADAKEIKFFTPDGAVVNKCDIKSKMILLDHEHKMVLTGHDFHWVDTGYAPVAKSKMVVMVRHKDKEQEVLSKCKEMLDLGLTMYALKQNEYYNPGDGFTSLKMFFTNPVMINPSTHGGQLATMGFMQEIRKDLFNKALREVCTTKEEFAYLKFSD